MITGTRHELSKRAAWDARRNAEAAERQTNPEPEDDAALDNGQGECIIMKGQHDDKTRNQTAFPPTSQGDRR